MAELSTIPSARHEFSYSRGDTPLDTIRRLRHLKPAFELREKWSYNNLVRSQSVYVSLHSLSSLQMYVAASHIIAVYSAQPFRDFVKERIFDPLNMTSTTYSGDEAAARGLLSQSWSSQGRRLPYWFAGEAMSYFIAGAGGVLSNAVDMVSSELFQTVHNGRDLLH